MSEGLEISLGDPRISHEMRQLMREHGFRLMEFERGLVVIGEEEGEMFELGYSLFCAITKANYANEFANRNCAAKENGEAVEPILRN